MAKAHLDARKARGIARKALACIASIVLVVGLMPGIALADDPVNITGGQEYSKDGGLTVENTDSNFALMIDSSGTATIDGPVEFETDLRGNSADEAAAVFVKVRDESDEATAIIKGNVTANNHVKDWSASGVRVSVGADEASQPGGTANVTVTGDVTTSSDEAGGIAGVVVMNCFGTMNVNVNTEKGGVTVKSNPLGEGFSRVIGVGVSDMDGLATNVSAKNVSVAGSKIAWGVMAENKSEVKTNPINLSVGNIQAEGEWLSYGLQALAQETGSANIAVKGDIAAKATNSSEGVAVGIAAAHKLAHKQLGDEHWDITPTGKVSVFVDGTVSVEGKHSAGIMYTNQGSEEGLFDATVWRVVTADGGYVAAKGTGTIDGEGLIADLQEDAALEAVINYIIRVDEAVKGATLSAQGAKGQHRENGGKTYQVANKDERVYLTIGDLQEGYRVLGAYSVLDGKRTALEFDKEKGQYYYVVPNGGGVFLTADVSNLYDVAFKNGEDVLQSERLAYGVVPEYKGAVPTKGQTVESVYEFAGWEPVVDKVTGDAVYAAAFTERPREYSMSFDLGGGTWNGQTGTVTVPAAYGSTITLMTPTREGYEFQYWEGSRYEGGAPYKVEGEHAFKAVWQEKADPKPEPKPDPKPEPETKPTPAPEPATTKAATSATSASASTMPATGDGAPVMPIAATILFAAAAIAVSRKELSA